MKSVGIDNSLSVELRKVITWQYDQAKRFIELISMIGNFYYRSTQKFWDEMPGKIDLSKAGTGNDFPNSIWARIFGVRRPSSYEYGTLKSMSPGTFSLVLGNWMRLLASNASMGDGLIPNGVYAYQAYIDSLSTTRCGVLVDGYDMSMRVNPVNAGQGVLQIRDFASGHTIVNVVITNNRGSDLTLNKMTRAFPQVNETQDSYILLGENETGITIHSGDTAIVPFIFVGKKTIPSGTPVEVMFPYGSWVTGIEAATNGNAEYSSGIINDYIPFPSGVRSHDLDLGPVLGFDTQARGEGECYVFVEISAATGSPVTVPPTANITLESASFIISTESDMTIPGGEKGEFKFQTSGHSGTIPSVLRGTTVTVYITAGGSPVSGIISSATTSIVLPNEQESRSFVVVRVYSSQVISIPSGSKYTDGYGNEWTLAAYTIDPQTEEHPPREYEESSGPMFYTDVLFVCEGNKYLRAREITGITDSSGHEITYCTGASNPERSYADFKIGGLDESVFAWKNYDIKGVTDNVSV